MRQWVILLTTGFLSLSLGNYCSLVLSSFQEEFIFKPRPPGKTNRFLTNRKQKVGQIGPWFVPILWFLWCTHPASREPSSNTAQQLAEVTRGMLRLRQAISHPWLPHSTLVLQFPNSCQQLQRMLQFQTSVFTWGTCTFWWAHFFPLPVTGTVTVRQNTTYFPHTYLTPFKFRSSFWQPWITDRATVAFTLWTQQVLFSREKEAFLPILFLPLFCSFKWCDHFKNGFFTQHECSCSRDTLKPLPPDSRLPLNRYLIFAISRSKIFSNLVIGKDCLLFLAKRGNVLLDKECWQGCSYRHFLCKLQ